MTDTLTAARPDALVDMPLLTSLEVEHLCDFSIHFEPLQSFVTARGARSIYVIRGGQVAGPRLNGEFLPGGGDWVTIDQNGVATLDVRATIRTDDGELIYFTNSGRARVPAEARSKLLSGKLLVWNEIYARSSPLFETGAEKYIWLNGMVSVAVNEFSLSQVNYRIYGVK